MRAKSRVMWWWVVVDFLGGGVDERGLPTNRVSYCFQPRLKIALLN